MHYAPKACISWSDEEVAERCIRAFTPAYGSTEASMERLLSEPERHERYRSHLGSLSMFIKRFEHPIAIRVKRGYKAKGHMFEKCSYSDVLLDEKAVLTAMRYVDLNPNRAKIADSLKAADHTPIQIRLKAIADQPKRLNLYLTTLANGIRSWHDDDHARESNSLAVSITLDDYIQLLKDAIAISHSNQASPKSSLRPARAR